MDTLKEEEVKDGTAGDASGSKGPEETPAATDAAGTPEADGAPVEAPKLSVISNTAKTVTLPFSGMIVTKRRAKGYDAVNAGDIMGKKPSFYMAALAAQVCKFNGKPLTMEEILDLDHDDYFAIVEMLTPEGAFTSPATI